MVPITCPPHSLVAPASTPDHAVDGAFELDELLGVGPHRSAELRGQTRDDLHLIRDRIQRAREIVRRHRSAFDFTTRRREPRAWVNASINNAFKLTFRCRFSE